MDGSTRDELAGEVFRLSNMVDTLERLYMESQGVETEETAAIEAYVATASEFTVEALCEYIAEIDARREYGKHKAEQLRALSERLDRRERFAKRALMDTLSKLGKRSMDAGTYAVSLVAGRDMAVQTDEFDVEALSEDMVATTVKVASDKAKVLAALKLGKPVPGFVLGKTAQGVRIR